jgi:predicted SnoaL-like aldol condensation-catalyzing enzyme
MGTLIQDKNKAVVLEAFDTLFNKRDYVAAERYWSPTYIQHSAHIAPGREGLFNLIKSLPPTLKYEAGLLVADGDFVIVHGRFSGFGVPVNWIAADILRINDGVLVEHWDVIQDEATQTNPRAAGPCSATRSQSINARSRLTTTARDSMWGPTFPELVEALSGVEIIDRSSVNAFDDERVARAIAATGHKKVIFAGISLEVCAAFPAQRDQASGRIAAHAAGRRHSLGLRDLDGGDPQGQWATGGRRGLRGLDMPWAKLVGQIAQAYGK